MFATAVRIEHDLGVPSVSLNALTGHCSCAPEDCSGLVAIPPQGPVPVSGVFPAGAAFRLLETGLQVIRLSPYRADLPARHPVRLGMCCRLAGMLFSHSVFRLPVSHQIQRQSPLVPARCAGNTTVHLMAHRLLRTCSRPGPAARSARRCARGRSAICLPPPPAGRGWQQPSAHRKGHTALEHQHGPPVRQEADPGLSQGAGVCLRPSRAVRTIPVAR
jgi:hypothetical protein